ncbi:hypothetical protein BDZ89DRAFT_1166756 [Hymenopellis radicata]|nr:hypothetical protein BDZ89DRAFT_1166756 [Hymenopellis radicata]
MSPQLPIELIDIIVDHHSTDSETLLSLVSASRQFKRARRYLYRRVCITFEPRAPKRGLPLYRFRELLSFYGADISPYVQSITLRRLMLVMKGAYGRRNDVKKLRQVLEQLTGLSDMVLEFEHCHRADAGTDSMFNALASALASPRVQSMSLVGSVHSFNPKQGFHAILSQFPGLKTLVLSHCPLSYCPFETFRFPSQHGIKSLYIFSYVSPHLSADLHSSRVGPPSAYWKWGCKVQYDLYPELTAQVLQNLDGIVLDARYCETVGERLTSLASSLRPGNRVRMIGFVIRITLYRPDMLTSSDEARAWGLFFTRALESGVQTLCFTLTRKTVVPIATVERGLQLFRCRCENLLARNDPLRKLRVRYAASQDRDRAEKEQVFVSSKVISHLQLNIDVQAAPNCQAPQKVQSFSICFFHHGSEHETLKLDVLDVLADFSALEGEKIMEALKR